MISLYGDDDAEIVNELQPPVLPSLDGIFAPNGILSAAAAAAGRTYELRPQQLELSHAVTQAFLTKRHLVAEAPTGIGKSFAYLVPAILHAMRTGGTVLVSTHTIALQQQLIERDLPALKAALGLNFRAELAKGRSNYLCMRRLKGAASRNLDYLPDAELMPEIDRIALWAEGAREGDRQELDFRIRPESWMAVNAEEGNCLNQHCPFFKPCHFQNGRRRLQGAHVIVANHALFLADLAIKSETGDLKSGILPEYNAVIIDEAHTLEDVASNHLGLRLSAGGMVQAVQRVFHPRTGRGLLAGQDYPKEQQRCADLLMRCRSFFDDLAEWLRGRDTSILRHTNPEAIPDQLSPDLNALAATLERELEKEDLAVDRRSELSSAAKRLRRLSSNFHSFLTQSEEGFVYWFEKDQQERVTMQASPIDAAVPLRLLLFNAGIPCVLTSATLAVRQKLAWFRFRCGIDVADELLLDSPFDFARQMTLHAPVGMPSPKAPDFLDHALPKIRHYLTLSHGKAFVLFTSYTMLRAAAENLGPFLRDKGIRMLVQGDGLSNRSLLEAFRDDIDSVLLGTDSFWTGVDVPGASLSNVIITRLPFSVPDHPLSKARHEACEARGGDPFRELSLPEAVVKFRQGVGRLVRSATDHGMVVVLDPRLTGSSFGKIFLDSLPKCPIVKE